MFKRRFQRTKVHFAILGIDFLPHFCSTVRPHTGTLQCVGAESQISTVKHILNLHESDDTNLFFTKHHGIMDVNLALDELLDKYSDLFDVEKFKQPPLHHAKHYIRTPGPPVCNQVKLSPEKQAIVK